jgi:F-type H+-transporting ATPase subunit alpha
MLYSQFEELEAFARYGTHMDSKTINIIEHGKRIRACLNQNEFDAIPTIEQLFVLLALTHDLFDPVPLELMEAVESAVRRIADTFAPDQIMNIYTASVLSEENKTLILARAKDALEALHETNGSHETKELTNHE